MTAPAPPEDLSTLATSINAEIDAAERDARSAVEHARRAGELLLEAKARVAHGEWLPWIEAHCSVSVRTAQAYMRLARGLAELPVREALAALAEPKTSDDRSGRSRATRPTRARARRANSAAAARAQGRIVTAPNADAPCPRCAPLAAELAETLRQLADARERCAELLVALREWNRAAAAALDGREEVRPCRL